MVAGTNNVNIPLSKLAKEDTYGTETLSTTDAPKKDTNTNIVPLVMKLAVSSWVMFSNPTTTPSKNTTHNKVPLYAPPNPNPKSTAKTKPIKKDQLPTSADLAPLLAGATAFAFAIITITSYF
ncbi:MAG TPA: hypothetical protein VJI32_00740 [Candidatus Nanoarchaeia archaeon]|nr:hypothetical protein [Candidatus Nanoarchaeia archaeon]